MIIDRLDQNIGRLVRKLKDLGELDNTLILFLSDNGASAEIMVRGDGHDPGAPAGSADTYLCLGPGWSTVSSAPQASPGSHMIRSLSASEPAMTRGTVSRPGRAASISPFPSL